ncbi:MAG: CRISPR-associated endoribonuclease Cas6 [Caloramator sp.]|nr:CRISPR-associated endoribonuclease Cas6 [Caloramator sp.]
MRIKITMESQKEQIIDINYNYYLSSLIYSYLKKSNEEYSSFLHDEGYKSQSRAYKMFTFSKLFPEKYEIEGKSLKIDGKVTWYVSSPMREFLMYFVDCLASSTEIKIGNGKFRALNLEVVPPPIFKENMEFTCLSPVAISTAYLTDDLKLKKIDLYLEDKKFCENIRANIISKYSIIHGKEPDNKEFNVEFIDVEKHRKGKLITYKDDIKIKGYLAPMVIRGNTELIQTAYECGLGDRNSLGFGMIKERR